MGRSGVTGAEPGRTEIERNYVEKEFSSTASLIVFLALFFSNFAVSWIAVILFSN
jgi:hypothetical protein